MPEGLRMRVGLGNHKGLWDKPRPDHDPKKKIRPSYDGHENSQLFWPHSMLKRPQSFTPTSA